MSSERGVWAVFGDYRVIEEHDHLNLYFRIDDENFKFVRMLTDFEEAMLYGAFDNGYVYGMEMGGS